MLPESLRDFAQSKAHPSRQNTGRHIFCRDCLSIVWNASCGLAPTTPISFDNFVKFHIN